MNISKRVFSTLILLTVLSLSSWSQAIWSNPINDAAPANYNPYTIGDVVAANLNVSGIGRGPGISANAAGARYNATSWNLASMDLNDYFTFTLTPSAGYMLNLVSFSYTGQRSNTGPQTFVIRSSVDNYTSNIASVGATSGNVSLTGASFQNLTGSITFRFYGWGGTNSGGTYSINDFVFNGNLVASSCTAPTTQASAFTFPTVNPTSASVSWTNGNGGGRVVMVNTTNTFTAPTDGSNPTANTVYGGSGQQVVYNGTGSGPVTVTGLTPETTYYFRVFEFCTPTRNYQTGTATNNPNSVQTIAMPSTITTTGSYGPFCNETANNVNVTYTTTGTFTGTYTAQLSDAAGSFAGPTVIGTGASPIAAVLPAGLPAGTGYRIRVVNDNPAIDGSANTTNIIVSGLPVVHLGNDTAYCAGTAFNLTLNAQNAGAAYDWNNGAAATQTFVATTAGTYTVKVTNPGGCIANDTLVVTENALPAVNLGNDTAYCAGTAFSLTLDAGNAGATYDWNGGTATTQTFDVTGDGTYTVSVTDANGCVGTDNLTVTENTLPVVALGNDTAYCAGTTFNLTLDAGNAGATYDWNGGEASTQTFGVGEDGTYTVTVTDANGCVGTDELTVTENALPVVNLGNDTAYCVGTTFNLTLDAGNAGATYDWNGGEASTQTFAVSEAGTYTITVTDANGCENSDEITVTENTLPVVNLGNDTAYCAGTAFSLILDAANAGATYDWNNGTASTQTFEATAAGTHTVTVTDANGCVGTDELTVTENTLPVVNLGNDTAYCVGNTISMTLDAGNAGNTFDWNNGEAATQTFDIDGAGTYTVTVTDANGCENTDGLTVTENSLPVVDLGGNTLYCIGSNFSTTLDAGTPGSTYDWNNGEATTQTFDVDTAGTYSVTVTDINGCVSSDTATVTEKPLPVVNLGNDTAYCAGTAFSMVLDAQNPGASYSWNGGAATTQTFTANGAGTYTVNVTDVYGCSGNASITVTQNAAPSVSLGADIVTLDTLQVLNAGSGFASYAWTPGGQTTQQITVHQSGNYGVTVTNANGCTGSDTVHVSVGTASINENAATQINFSVYPNPTAGMLNWSLDYTGSLSVTVLTVSGQTVYAEKPAAYGANQTSTLDLSHLPSGIYIIRLQGDKVATQKRIVIGH